MNQQEVRNMIPFNKEGLGLKASYHLRKLEKMLDYYKYDELELSLLKQEILMLTKRKDEKESA